MLIMRPPPACFMTAATARLNVKAAPMLTTKRRSQSASGTSSMRRICCPVTPLALLTSTSTAPPVVRSICAIHAAVYQSLTGRLAAARPGNVGARTLRHCRGGGPVSVTLKHSYTETCEGCGWLPQDIGMLDRRRPTRSGRPGGGNTEIRQTHRWREPDSNLRSPSCHSETAACTGKSWTQPCRNRTKRSRAGRQQRLISKPASWPRYRPPSPGTADGERR